MSSKKEKIPIVRFKDFSEAWLKNQLSEVAEFSKGRGYSKKDLQSHGTPIILYGRLYTNYESAISNVETYANLEENSVISKGGEVIIPASGESADDISRASCVIDRGIILGGDLNIVRPHEYLNSLFIAITLSNGSQQRELSKRAQGKSVVHLHNSDLKVVKLFYPSYEEQSAIGSLFRTLDDLLTSYKDNLANYQSLKATMLSKMFPKAGQTVPEIRLDGFEGEWKKSKLKDVAHRVQGNDGRMDLPTLTISASGGWMNQIDRFSANIAGKEQKNYTLLKKGELSYNHGNSKLAKYGVVFELQDYEEALVPKIYHSFRVNQLVDAKFIEIMFSTKIPDRELGKLVSSGARMDGLLNISFDDFMNITIIIPTIEEQQAIGAYFFNLDNLINSHQEKITQLKTLKKKLLQYMFI